MRTRVARWKVWCIALLSGVAWPALVIGFAFLWARLIIDPCVADDCDAGNRFANTIFFFLGVMPLSIATAPIAWTFIIGLVTRKSLPVQTSVRILTAVCLAVLTGFVAATVLALALSDVSAPVVYAVFLLATSIPAAAAIFYLAHEAERRAVVLYGRPKLANTD